MPQQAFLSDAPSASLPLLWRAVLREAHVIAASLLSIRVLSALGFAAALFICPVQVFASIGVLLAALNLISVAIFGRFELLIVGAHDDRRCADASHLCLGAALLVSTVVFASASAFGPSAWIPQFALLFTLGLALRAWLRLGLTYATRAGSYQAAVKAMIPHAVGQPMVLLALTSSGCEPLLAFVLADIAGHLIACIGVTINQRAAFRHNFSVLPSVARMQMLARDNLGLPTGNLVAAVSAMLFSMIPLIYLPTLANTLLAGTFALLFRMLELPASLTASSLSPILVKEVARRHCDGDRLRSDGIFILPAAAAVVIFGVITVAALWLNVTDLVPAHFRLALAILPAVALVQASVAATAPLIEMAGLAGRQHFVLVLNLCSAALAFCALIAWRDNPLLAIVAVGIVGATRAMFMTYWLIHSERRRLQTLAVA